MEKPVILPDGHTYEQNNIEEWLKKSNTSPITKEVFEANVRLIPNLALKDCIEYVQKKKTTSTIKSSEQPDLASFNPNFFPLKDRRYSTIQAIQEVNGELIVTTERETFQLNPVETNFFKEIKKQSFEDIYQRYMNQGATIYNCSGYGGHIIDLVKNKPLYKLLSALRHETVLHVPIEIPHWEKNKELKQPKKTFSTSIKLEGQSLGGEVIDILKDSLEQNPTNELIEIILRDNNLTESDCEQLALLLTRCNTLRDFYLDFNPIGDQGFNQIVKALITLPQIETVTFERCALTDQCMKSVNELLEYNKKLLSISLCDNTISDQGVESILTQAGSHPIIDTIHLSDTQVSARMQERLDEIMYSKFASKLNLQ